MRLDDAFDDDRTLAGSADAERRANQYGNEENLKDLTLRESLDQRRRDDAHKEASGREAVRGIGQLVDVLVAVKLVACSPSPQVERRSPQ